MNTFDPTCTEPGQWHQAPDEDAPASMILAYLQHCDDCEYHAMLNLEEDLSLDVLLRDATRDLSVDDVVLPAAVQTTTPLRHRDNRVPQRPLVQERYHFERSLTQACIAAFSIVVLWVAFTAYPFGEAPPDELPVAQLEEPAPPPAVSLSVQSIAERQEGRLFLPRIAEETGQLIHGGALHEVGQLTVAAPGLVPGSYLRVTNPLNGISVAVKVIRQISQDREIVLTQRAADSLRLDNAAYVFVEVISEPRSDPASFAP